LCDNSALVTDMVSQCVLWQLAANAFLVSPKVT
jgi:hypothetical protein